MGQTRRDEASSPHGHSALSCACQGMQGASPAPYVLQSFLRFHLGNSSHLAPAPACRIVIVCLFLLITMCKSLIQLPHRLLVHNVVTVIRVNLTAEKIRQNWLLCAWHRDEASRFDSLSIELSAMVDKLFSKTLWHPTARMHFIQFLFHIYGVDEVARAIKVKRETIQTP
jgi:hypothetical protein